MPFHDGSEVGWPKTGSSSNPWPEVLRLVTLATLAWPQSHEILPLL
jgi:hypothetical protein